MIAAVQTKKQPMGKFETKSQTKEPCGRCGRFPPRSRQNCPAKDTKCFKCQKVGHFGTVCRTKTVSTIISGRDPIPDQEDLFQGNLSTSDSKPWTVHILVDNNPVTFKVDTGADVTVLQESLVREWGNEIEPCEKSLKGPSNMS